MRAGTPHHTLLHPAPHPNSTNAARSYWGMWNIAHNLGGFAAPLVAGGFAKAFGWKWGMWAPGIIGLVVGCFVMLFW